MTEPPHNSAAQRARYSRIAHALLPFSAPIGEDVVADLLTILPVPDRALVLDVGCGRAEMLMRVAERHTGATCVGVDIDAETVDAATREAHARGLSDRVTLKAYAAADIPAEPLYDVAMCVGSSHACGGFDAALDFLAARTRPSAYVVMGEGFWERSPSTAYLAAIDGTEDEMRSHAGNVAAARARGFTPVWSFVSRPGDWDRYEGLYRFAMHRHLRTVVDDPDRSAYAQRSEAWYDAYVTMGRGTMGFALYLFARTAHDAAPALR